jgi:TRAP-type mannitol/chloroaromatic compound transport system substrate-binding protein
MKKYFTNRRAILRGAMLAPLAAPALVGKGLAQGAVTWRVQSHWPKASSSFSDSLGVLASELEKRTDGAFRLELFGAGEFGKGKDIYQLIKRGVLPMGTCSPSYFQGEVQAASFGYGIPGTFREPWEMQHAIKNLGIEDLMNEEMIPTGVLYKSEKVYPTELVVSKKIETAGDFAGLKLRSSGTTLDYLAAAGAAPQYIPGAELYQSLSSGVVDGAHWGAAIGAKSMSLWEVAKYHVKPSLGLTGDGFIVNIKELEKLDSEMQLILTTLMEERFWRRSAEYSHKEAIALAAGKAENGVEVINLPDEVTEMLVQASSDILAAEAAKGELAARAADAYTGLMKDLGYL